MKIGDEAAVAELVRKMRQRAALSQADLAERARLATKTVQRLESGRPIAAHSRRAVFEVLGIDPLALDDPAEKASSTEAAWVEVTTARVLLARLRAADSVEIDLDREAWRAARRARPWHKQDVLIAIGDPVALILQIVDQAIKTGTPSLTPGQAAKQCDELAEAMRAAQVMAWAFAVGGTDDSLSLYIGSPAGVGERVDRVSASG